MNILLIILFLLICFLVFYIGVLRYEVVFLKRKQDYWNKRYNDLVSKLRRLE